MKLTNVQVAAGCEESKRKYLAMSFDNANISFSYEFQGYIAAMVEKHGMTLEQVLIKIEDLGMLLRSNNL